MLARGSLLTEVVSTGTGTGAALIHHRRYSPLIQKRGAGGHSPPQGAHSLQGGCVRSAGADGWLGGGSSSAARRPGPRIPRDSEVTNARWRMTILSPCAAGARGAGGRRSLRLPKSARDG